MAMSCFLALSTAPAYITVHCWPVELPQYLSSLSQQLSFSSQGDPQEESWASCRTLLRENDLLDCILLVLSSWYPALVHDSIFQKWPDASTTRANKLRSCSSSSAMGRASPRDRLLQRSSTPISLCSFSLSSLVLLTVVFGSGIQTGRH